MGTMSGKNINFKLCLLRKPYGGARMGDTYKADSFLVLNFTAVLFVQPIVI